MKLIRYFFAPLRWVFDLIRPICPACDGKGGGMSGYYEPEFYGCQCCNPNEDREEKVTRVWFSQVWEWNERIKAEDRWVDEQAAKFQNPTTEKVS